MAIINIRRLAELDLALHGKRFILPEFTAGVIAPIALGAYTLTLEYSFLEALLGIYLLLLGLNYLPILLYAVTASRKSNERIDYSTASPVVRQEIKKYSLQQVIIFVPLAVLLLALTQKRMRTMNSREETPYP